MSEHERSPLLTREEACARMGKAGLDYSPWTLRAWRSTWPTGERRGPMPLLLSPRKLRYRQADVDAFIAEVIGAAVDLATEGQR